MSRSRRCAIHQPNLFPRLATLAKLFAADIWVSLDDVQFASRDYQHRARLAAVDDPTRQQWLTLPVHRPSGRLSRIDEVRVIEPASSARRTMLLTQQYYGRSPHWPVLARIVGVTAELINAGAPLASVTEASTTAMLSAIGWRGHVVRSTELTSRTGRSERLADLVGAVGAGEYLCGRGGARYLDHAPFADAGITVRFVDLLDPDNVRQPRQVTGLRALAMMGRSTVELIGPAGQGAQGLAMRQVTSGLKLVWDS